MPIFFFKIRKMKIKRDLFVNTPAGVFAAGGKIYVSDKSIERIGWFAPDPMPCIPRKTINSGGFLAKAAAMLLQIPVDDIASSDN